MPRPRLLQPLKMPQVKTAASSLLLRGNCGIMAAKHDGQDDARALPAPVPMANDPIHTLCSWHNNCKAAILLPGAPLGRGISPQPAGARAPASRTNGGRPLMGNHFAAGYPFGAGPVWRLWAGLVFQKEVFYVILYLYPAGHPPAGNHPHL